MKFATLCASFIAFSATGAAAAQVESEKKAADAPPKAATPVEKDPAPSVTEHEITIGGAKIRYRATAGFLVLKTEKGEPRANIFYVAYTKLGDDHPAKRPLTFSFNGGPGSSSVWLHLGALGPKRVVMTDKGESLPPPYRWTDNEYAWLDKTDLVFIDPVSTGYSRAAKDVDPKQFHGFTGDIESVGDFIRLWTTRNERWASPKFLVGESYGTTRAAALSDFLASRYDMYLNGIMLVSAITNFQTARFGPGNDLPYQLFLPTYTATAWYHKKLKGDWARTLPSALQRAENFVARDYTLALMQGDALPAAEFDRIATEVAALTGLSVDFVKRHNLRISTQRFVRELRREERRAVGRLDSRIDGILDESEGTGPDGPNAFDPSLEAITGPYTNAINAYVRGDLKFESDLNYEILTGRVQPWSYANVENQYLNVAETLKRAMTRNPFLRVWIANGYYDLATPYYATDWTVRHMNLDPSIRKNVSQTFYESGHMMYIHLESLKKFKADFVQWIEAGVR
jgi:carboxypeptidase C (cathepsin A)